MPLNSVEIEYDAKYFNKAIFIIGSGESGTTLLQGLFDGHPNLVVFPVESCYYQNDFDPIASKNYKGHKKFLEYWIKESKFSWMAYGRYTEHIIEKQRDFSAVNFDLFRTILYSYDFSKHTRLRFYKVLLEAYRQSLGQLVSELVGFVDKTPVHMFEIEKIRKDFLHARFIHMLRDPFDNYYAYRTNELKLNPELDFTYLLKKYIERYIAPSFEIADQHRNEYGDYYKVIRYEDLVTNVEETLGVLTEWAEVPYHNTLLTVTLCGRPSSGNSSSGEQFQSISNSRIGHGFKNLTNEERRYIHKRLGKLPNKFGYLTK